MNRKTIAAGLVGLAVWSCFVATAHGAGLMLIPVLMPICLSGRPSQSLAVTGSIPIGIAALGVHTGAMLTTIGLVSIAVYEWIGLEILKRAWINLDVVWTLALIAAGACLFFL